MGKIFVNDFSTFPSTLRRADLVNHTCSRGHFAHGDLFRDVPFKCWEIQIHARFRLLLPEAHPQPLSSLLEFTILRYSFSESHHISTWEAGGGHVSGRSMTVTVVCKTLRRLNLMHNVAWICDDPSYMVCGRISSTLFHNTPLWPGLFLSFIPEFLERSVKILCQHIFHQIITPPLASSRHQRPKYLIRDYTPGRKLKIKAFQRRDVWDLYVSLNSNFNTYVDTNSNDSCTKFKRSWGHMCNYCWKMLLNKKQSEFVHQHLHVKHCWTKPLNKESIAPFQRSDVRVFADLFWSLRLVPLDFQRWEICWKTNPWIAWFCPYSS